MPFSEIERKRKDLVITRFMSRRRPPPRLRAKVDLAFEIAAHSIEIFEVRPHWKDEGLTLRTAVAKAAFVRAHSHWKVFWMPSDLKWHRYDPVPVVDSLEAFLQSVDRDEHCCFFG